MKKVLLLLAVLLIGCTSDEENNCSCTKDVYDLETYTVIVNNNQQLRNRYVFKYSEDVVCQEETPNYVIIGNSQAFKINCN